jgi:F420-dependent oxidoreductase-like protein
MNRKIRFGIQTPPQNVTWNRLVEAWQLIDSLDYDTVWVFDHFFAILSDPSGPCLEGWTALSALAAGTSRVKTGVLVTGNTYRHPALLAKMGATVDHIAGGRLIMGIGAAWFEMEHNAYGIPFYTTAERIHRLDEAAQIIKLLWTEKQATFNGRYYSLSQAFCEPKPLQRPYPPIMIGGAGEKLTLRVVAKHADQWNTFGTPELFKHKIAVLGEHCSAVGRDLNDIEISWAGATLVTDSTDVKDQLVGHMAKAFRRPLEDVEPGLLVGPVGMIRDRLHRLVEAGVTHFIFTLPPPFDRRTIERFAEDIIPEFRK